MQYSHRQLQISDVGDYCGAQNLNFALKFPQNGDLWSKILYFWKKIFRQSRAPTTMPLVLSDGHITEAYMICVSSSCSNHLSFLVFLFEAFYISRNHLFLDF